MKIVIVDDQRSARRVLRGMLGALENVEVAEAGSAEEAFTLVQRALPDLLLLDIRLSEDARDRSGLDLLRRLRATGAAVPAVMVTSLVELAEIREAMRCGAQDYVLKDELCPEMLLPIVETFRERLALQGEVARLRARVDRAYGLGAIVGSSRPVEIVRGLVKRVADAVAPVLIRGETGTGKELVARALHETSSRHAEPFVAVNVSALPGTLIESLVFGHERGAFTGADRRTRGQLELAGAGTILLDEIAEMPIDLQAKLLRVLEDRRFRPLGSEEERPLKARVVASTHVDLEGRIAEGRFREDLFYRLNVVTIHVPPLAERVEDMPELVSAFASELPRKLHFTEEAMAFLQRRPWPGNVRELRNVVERLALLADRDTIDVEALEDLAGAPASGDARMEIDRMARSLLALPERLGSKLDVIERAVLHHAIEACGGNKSAAARLIGVDRKALERRWERLSDAPPSEPSGSRNQE
ncbi:MAG TPA: sigma-54 dependent transcriptional regulator [Polyangiaceae bacterium]|nr:sigma-54 dependent transcriptional regulator [Polyangiaceae bacterium]